MPQSIAIRYLYIATDLSRLYAYSTYLSYLQALIIIYCWWRLRSKSKKTSKTTHNKTNKYHNSHSARCAWTGRKSDQAVAHSQGQGAGHSYQQLSNQNQKLGQTNTTRCVNHDQQTQGQLPPLSRRYQQHSQRHLHIHLNRFRRYRRSINGIIKS